MRIKHRHQTWVNRDLMQQDSWGRTAAKSYGVTSVTSCVESILVHFQFVAAVLLLFTTSKQGARGSEENVSTFIHLFAFHLIIFPNKRVRGIMKFKLFGTTGTSFYSIKSINCSGCVFSCKLNKPSSFLKSSMFLFFYSFNNLRSLVKFKTSYKLIHAIFWWLVSMIY